MTQTQQTRLQVRPLDHALGAEVRGIGPSQPVDDATFEEPHDTWMHRVVAFPEQRMSDEDHVRILAHLGLPTRALPRAPAQRIDLFQAA